MKRQSRPHALTRRSSRLAGAGAHTSTPSEGVICSLLTRLQSRGRGVVTPVAVGTFIAHEASAGKALLQTRRCAGVNREERPQASERLRDDDIAPLLAS